MEIFVSGRQTGKTTALIDWLLDGHEVDMYPYWSRVIVCVTQNAVLHTQRMVRERIERMLRGDDTLDWIVHQMRKCVWHRRDLISGGIHRGMRRGLKHPFEIAVDDVDLVLMEYFGQAVDLATMTGELYDPSSRPPPATEVTSGHTDDGRDRSSGSRSGNRNRDLPPKTVNPRDELRRRNDKPRTRRPPRIT